MSLSLLTFRADNKFAHESLLVHSRRPRWGRRRAKRVNPTAMLENATDHKDTNTASASTLFNYHRNDAATTIPKSLDDICQRLKYNEIIHVRIGYQDSNFLTTKRAGLQLEKALMFNTSLRSISIGWRHANREALLTILRALARYTRLQSLQLILDDWLPETLLRQLLQSQSDSLETIDIRSVHVLRKTAFGRVCCEPKQASHTVSSQHYHHYHQSHQQHHYHQNQHHSQKHAPSHGANTIQVPCDHSVVSRVLVHVRSYLPQLKKIYLHDIGLTDKHAVMLADCIHIRGGISELSLRNNRSVGRHGVEVLLQAPVLHVLDMSLCDMDPDTAQVIAPALERRQLPPLRKLILCGNYRMGTEALVALVQPQVCRHVERLDISYCDITDSRTVLILQGLQLMRTVPADEIMLREISMQGAHVSNAKALDALVDLLQRNLPLRVMRLNDPGSKAVGLTGAQLTTVATGLKDNFEVEEFLVDDCCTRSERERVWPALDFYLKLNQCGRRLLLSSSSGILAHHPCQPNQGCGIVKNKEEIKYEDAHDTTINSSSSVKGTARAPNYYSDGRDDDWMEVLKRTVQTQDLNIIFWMVRHAVDRFS